MSTEKCGGGSGTSTDNDTLQAAPYRSIILPNVSVGIRLSHVSSAGAQSEYLVPASSTREVKKKQLF